jgi:Cytochrome c7 and related cytochrome c
MSELSPIYDKPRRLRGGPWGVILVIAFILTAVFLWIGYDIYPYWTRSYGKEIAFNRAMFFNAIAQPISFSHRLHVTDKQIDCYYCHPYVERSLNAGLPTGQKCLGCHNHIIPSHQEIQLLKGYVNSGVEIPWIRVYYNPDHVFFPHYRHIKKGLRCQECHGEVEKVDRLHKVTFYMGFCIECHKRKNASRECVACHQ